MLNISSIVNFFFKFFKKKILFTFCLMIPYDYNCYYCFRLPEEAEKYTAKRGNILKM